MQSDLINVAKTKGRCAYFVIDIQVTGTRESKLLDVPKIDRRQVFRGNDPIGCMSQ